MANNNQSVDKGAADHAKRVEITLLSGNLALLDRLAEQLPSLRDFADLLLVTQRPLEGQQGWVPCSVFPASLVSQVRAALKAAGHQVILVDRRQGEEELPVNKKYIQNSFYPEEKAFLRAAAASPLGQIEFRDNDDLVYRITALTCLFPESRSLVVVPYKSEVVRFYWDLKRMLGPRVGFAGQAYPEPPRCQIAPLCLLKHLRPRHWPVLLLLARRRRDLSKDAYRAVVRMCPQRVYALLSAGMRFGHRRRRRLEAIAGELIHEVEA
jgi:hypothetical protein